MNDRKAMNSFNLLSGGLYDGPEPWSSVVICSAILTIQQLEAALLDDIS